MAASLGAAIKAYLETKGLGLAFYKDAPPQSTKMPYGTIVEDIGLRMDKLESGGPANGAEATGKELVQLDLWQNWLKADGTVAEDPLLADKITRAIHGTRLNTSGTGIPPMRVYAVLQEGRVRMLDRDGKTVHHAYTLAVYRTI